MHEDLTLKDIVQLIRSELPYASFIIMNGKLGVRFMLYEAFVVTGNWDDYGRGNWGFGIEIGDKMVVTEFFGQSTTLCETKDAVRQALQVIDAYVRLRLGKEFLKAYEHSAKRKPTNQQ